MMFRCPLVNRSCLVLVGVLVVASGCESTQETGSAQSGNRSTTSSTSSRASDTQARLDAQRSALDERYVLGPTAANAFGYRVDWNRAPVSSWRVEGNLVEVAGDSIFAMDNSNNLSRMLRSNGNVTWTQPVAGPADVILGIRRTTVGGRDVVLVMTEGDLHIIETNTGIQVDRQSLDRVSSTAPTVSSPILLYGSLSGTIIWHHLATGTYLDGYAMRGAIVHSPQIVDGTIVTATQPGHVMALDLSARAQLWSAFTRDEIIARPAVTPSAVYVASIDQYIRCWDLASGLVVWSRLHAAPLREPPIVIGDNVFVQTPDLGLCCYEALPFEDFDGNLRWSNKEIAGTVIGQHRNNLIAWEAGSRTLTLFDEDSGAVSETIKLPKVKILRFTSFESGDLFAISDDGTVTKAVPR